IQKTLDAVQGYMQDAAARTYSAPAGTRILYVLITQLSQQFLTEEQQQQVATLVEMHEYCLAHDGEVKNVKARSSNTGPSNFIGLFYEVLNLCVQGNKTLDFFLLTRPCKTALQEVPHKKAPCKEKRVRVPGALLPPQNRKKSALKSI